MIAVGRDEDLRLVAEAAEGNRVDDPVAVALENVAGPARAGTVFGMKAAARPVRVRRDAGRKAHSAATGTILSEAELVQRKESTPTVCRSSEKIRASEVPRKGPMTSLARPPLSAT